MPDAILPALLSLASHELRGPTGVLRGYLKMLEQDITLGERQQRAVAEATNASTRLVELLDQISELGRFKLGTARLSLKSLPLRSVLSQAVQAVSLPNSDVALDVVAPTEVRARVDEARLRAVFETLIVAVARAQNGAATLDLQLSPPRLKGGQAQIVVAIRTLGHGTVTEAPLDVSRGGMGLSLVIADSIISAHGGRLRERWLADRWVGFVVTL